MGLPLIYRGFDSRHLHRVFGGCFMKDVLNTYIVAQLLDVVNLKTKNVV